MLAPPLLAAAPAPPGEHRPDRFIAGPPSHGPRWFERTSIALLSILLTIGVRRPDVLFRPQFELEDGAVFCGQNYNFGWHAIFIPYSGYLHLIPRLVAFVAGALPLTLQPAAYAGVSLALLLAVIARLFRPAIRLPHKLWLALAVVLMVRGTGESLANLTSVQWFLALVPLLMILEDETTRSHQRAGWDVAALALIGLSSPIVALCTPLFAWRLTRTRSRWSALCLGVAMATGVIQQWFHHRQPVDPSVAPTAGQWAVFLGSKCAGVLLFGNNLAQTAVSPWIALGLLAGMVALLACLTRQQPALRQNTLAFAFFAALMLLGGVLRFVKTIDLCLPILQEDRYLYLPRLMLVWALLLHVGTRARWPRVLLGGVLSLVTLSAAVDLRCPVRPDRHWAQQVAGIHPGHWAWLKYNPHWNIYLDGPAMADDTPAGNPVRWRSVLDTPPVLVKPAASARPASVNGQPFLQLDAPGCLLFNIPAQSRAISGRCALPPGADTGPVVEFRLVLLSNSLPPALLWSHRCDPGVPSDRLPVRFQGALPFNDTGQIMLVVEPVSGDYPSHAGTAASACWANIVFQ